MNVAFSTRALQSIQAFAANLGLEVNAGPDGSYSFIFEHSGTLTFTSSRDGERTLVSLLASPERIDVDTERRLLDLAGPDITTERFLSTGLTRDGGAIFAVSVDDEEMNLPTLETCLQQLLAGRAAVG